MIRYYIGLAWRRCRQSPSMVALLTLTMAIGIASCMTTLTIFRALSGEPLPGISSHLQVVTMDAREAIDKDNNDYDKPDSYLNLVDAKALVDARRATRQVALAQSYSRLGNPDGKQSDQVQGLMAYGPLLDMFGVSLRHGRAWTLEEQAAHAPVVVIDSDLAEKLFGVENAVGRTVSMGRRVFRVTGISAPWKPRTQFLDLPRNQDNVIGQPEQFFVPAEAALEADVGPLTAGECGKAAAVITFQSAEIGKCRWLEVWAALRTPAAAVAYRQFVIGYADAQHSAGHFAYPPKAVLYDVQRWMATNHVVPDDVSLNLALAGAFLLLCLVNVAGLLAARFMRRQADVTIRRALGASRREVFLQHLVETALLGLVGGVLALPLTGLGLWVVRMQPVAYADAARFSPAAFGILLLLSLAVGLVVGILPAWRVCRQPPAMQIKLG